MIVLAACLGSAGDVLPFVTIGRELRRRGHTVIVLANPYHQPLIAAANLAFIPIGKIADQLAAMNNKYLFHRTKGLEVFFNHLIFPSILPAYQAIMDRYQPKQAIVLASRYAAGARLAQELGRVPTLSIILTPYGLSPLADPPLLSRRVNVLRADLGLPAAPHIFSRWLFSPERVVALFPGWFASPERRWPKPVSVTDFPFEHSPDANRLPAALKTFLSRGAAPLLFTPGTAMRHAVRFFKESAKACRLLGDRALFVTTQDEQIPAFLPDTIRHVRSAPFNALLRHAKAVIHPGGIGTSAEALRAGVPQLIVPLAYDQFDNAARLKKLGVALSLDQKAYRADRVAENLRRLTESRAICERCRAAAQRLKSRHPVRQVCDIIEAHASKSI